MESSGVVADCKPRRLKPALAVSADQSSSLPPGRPVMEDCVMDENTAETVAQVGAETAAGLPPWGNYPNPLATPLADEPVSVELPARLDDARRAGDPKAACAATAAAVARPSA